ncbi:NADP-dependent oxidoreductase domain-containing protein [Trametes gibbosa]|nr:NADP-dependent oxidoreductase domain-containing protein [Trametes gibbosa]
MRPLLLHVYSNGLSEVILGKAIKELNLPREELVILTKVYFPVASNYTINTISVNPEDLGIINQKGLNRKASLKRLQLDYIDVLQCHRFDYNTPIEETMQALHDIVKAGYVRYIGMSSCSAYQFIQMQNYAIQHNLTPFISMQNHYSLVYREEEREMFPTLKQMIGRYKNEATVQIVARVEELAKKKGAKMAQIALAWNLAKPGVSAPIIGTTNLSNLEELFVRLI